MKVKEVVKQYQRAIVLRFGRVRTDSPAGPGIIWVLPLTDSSILIDLRTQSFNLPSQEVTPFSHSNSIVFFICSSQATKLISVSTLRNILGQHTLSELLSDRVKISHSARSEIDKITNEWGVEMERVDIKDVILPFELQKAMAAEAEGTRVGKAKVIEAEGEIKAAENLREASRIMMENPQTMLLRYLQTLSFIAGQQKTSIVFPFPLELPEPESMKNARRPTV
ncbi:stomatin-like [Ostrinia nubilalis]|uniref:erythrocyte band 7 integral membrane protein-like n=2 Tax=Ostrinia furnacalis TaxID=93504 RepID=UPI00103FB233|nr:erythrocyte band 7 integral membrane protein-like [Ostrinia furnacalis]